MNARVGAHTGTAHAARRTPLRHGDIYGVIADGFG